MTHLEDDREGEAGLNTPADKWTQVRHVALIGVETEGRTRQKKLKQQLGATRDPRNSQKATLQSTSVHSHDLSLQPKTGWNLTPPLSLDRLTLYRHTQLLIRQLGE